MKSVKTGKLSNATFVSLNQCCFYSNRFKSFLILSTNMSSESAFSKHLRSLLVLRESEQVILKRQLIFCED